MTKKLLADFPVLFFAFLMAQQIFIFEFAY